MQTPTSKQIVGWREWVSLPGLNIPAIKAKIDTGARTSALHAFNVELYKEHGEPWVAFKIHPLQQNDKRIISGCAPVLDERQVSDSGGHREQRLVIQTDLQIGIYSWPIEMTLTCRDSMRFRMLLGRTAMENHLMVDPQASYLLGKKPHKPGKAK